MNIGNEDANYDEALLSGNVTWQMFCENNAKFAAVEFAVQCRAFVAENPMQTQGISAKDFGKKFADCFIKHFDVLTLTRPRTSASEAGYRTVESTTNRSSGQRLKSIGRSNTIDVTSGFVSRENAKQVAEVVTKGEADTNEAVSKERGKSLFRYLSFKVLRESSAGRTLKHLFRQTVEEAVASEDKNSTGHSLETKYKAKKERKLSSCRREIEKEGVLHLFTMPEDFDNLPNWERCRLVLFREDSNYSLELYVPVKASKPKASIMCSSIVEVRKTTSSEWPDNAHTFVLKTADVEFVFEAPDVAEMQMWLLAIVVPEASNLQVNQPNHRLSLSNDCAEGVIEANDANLRTPSKTVTHQRSTGLSSSSTALDQCTADSAVEPPAVDTVFTEYPWFHGLMLRMEASQLVLQQGVSGHGVFLVRQSETRLGEYVLTFNYQGRAKHLRMTMESNGRCRVNHLWFASMFEMLEHFRVHPIPLEAGGVTDILLTEYVICRPQTLQQQARAQSTGNIHELSTSPAAATAAPPPRPASNVVSDVVITHGGSVRIRTQSLENVGLPISLNCGRAVENTYSFV